jgi:hypothetical protein
MTGCAVSLTHDISAPGTFRRVARRNQANPLPFRLSGIGSDGRRFVCRSITSIS